VGEQTPGTACYPARLEVPLHAPFARAFTRTALLVAVAALAYIPANAAGGLGALPASFSGVLPCADCTGIRHQLNLYPGGAYILALTYLRDNRDETFYDMGHYGLDKDSTKLVLDYSEPNAMQFALTKSGSLRKLDLEGRLIESDLEYELQRESIVLPLEPRLKLTGGYTYMADAAVLTDCRSGLRFPVAPGGAAYALEQAFLDEKALRDSIAGPPQSKSTAKGAPATKITAPPSNEPPPLMVSVYARMLLRAPVGIEGNKPMLFIERLVETFPGESCGARGVTHALEGTRWVLTRLQGKPVRLAPQQRELMIGFDRTAHRVSGYSGCNQFSSSYERGPDGSGKLLMGPVAGTRMACVGPDLETPFLEALGRVQGSRITGQHLELLDAGGAVVARFEARNL